MKKISEKSANQQLTPDCIRVYIHTYTSMKTTIQGWIMYDGIINTEIAGQCRTFLLLHSYTSSTYRYIDTLYVNHDSTLDCTAFISESVCTLVCDWCHSILH